jgi:hypothetical protein
MHLLRVEVRAELLVQRREEDARRVPARLRPGRYDLKVEVFSMAGKAGPKKKKGKTKSDRPRT